jgi:membrane-bound lytic murein transglycosylase MltF
MERYPKELGELSWSNIYQRPDLQIIGIYLKLKENYDQYKFTREPLAFADAAYNGGNADVRREIRACKLGKDCDPTIWFNNVERFCVKKPGAHTGGRSACEINRYHVRDVFNRAEKYRASLGNK